jgi:uncharacterized repeat protein (TIGR03803 family)
MNQLQFKRSPVRQECRTIVANDVNLGNRPSMRAILGGVLTCLAPLALVNLTIAADASKSARVLHQFSLSDKRGFNPQGTLMRSTDGKLYGTTLNGGTHGHGTVYRIESDGTGFAVVHNFLEARNPVAGVTEGKDGFLYGTTESGGDYLWGTVFKLGKDGQGFTKLRSFRIDAPDGKKPNGCVAIDTDGVCYGTTTVGGPYLSGTIFRIGPNGEDYRVLYSFVGKQRMDGSVPRGSLLLATDGDVYGTTSEGGRHELGTIFAIQKNGANYRLLHAFGGHVGDGATPYAGLLEGSDGRLYGTTIAGGSPLRQGTVFSLKKDGGDYQTLRSFGGLKNDGQNPYAPLIEGRDGKLYGTTLNGGVNGSGLVFHLGKDGKDYSPIMLFSMEAPEGRWPYGGVVQDENGVIYGATTSGATNRQGAVFKLGPVSR